MEQHSILIYILLAIVITNLIRLKPIKTEDDGTA